MYGAELLLPVLDMDREAFLTLVKRILDDNGHIALCENLAETGHIDLALKVGLSILCNS